MRKIEIVIGIAMPLAALLFPAITGFPIFESWTTAFFGIPVFVSVGIGVGTVLGLWLENEIDVLIAYAPGVPMIIISLVVSFAFLIGSGNLLFCIIYLAPAMLVLVKIATSMLRRKTKLDGGDRFNVPDEGQ